MTWAFLIVASLYVAALAYCAVRGRRESGGERSDFLHAHKGIGSTLAFLTFSATLFSTFTLMGMPDFFRAHGVGAWIFLGVTDVAMAFVALWFGRPLRRRMAGSKFTSVSDLLNRSYGGRLAGIVYLIGVFIFLLPYVAIQIRGIVIFLEAVVPGHVPVWVWSFGIMGIIVIYSTIGGLRAIIYSDAVQGVVLLVVTWIVAVACVSHFGGIGALFAQLASDKPALLSTPGPSGLFSAQYLLSSFIVIALMPISQPQLTSRLMYPKHDRDLRRMAVAVGIFAFFVILPTVFIGLYGALQYSGASTAAFLSGVLVTEQSALIGALAIVGLIAAAMSTADSQLFALGTEIETVLPARMTKSLTWTKLAVLIFAVLATALALVSNDQLVMLARVSFAGTAMIAPMVLAAVLWRRALGTEIPLISLGAVILFLLPNLGVLPAMLLGVRIELVLLLVVSVSVLASIVIRYPFSLEKVEPA